MTRKMEKQRDLYLVAYDVCNPSRLHKVCRYLTGYKVGGQKSVFEIWATAGELRQIRADLDRLMEPAEDRLHILALDPRMKPRCMGRASSFAQQYFSVV
jgi:CRISPR-associated protein Cas2